MHRLRRPTALCAILVCAALFSGAGQPAPPRRITFTAEQQAALDRVSAYLNSIHSIKSGFVQLGPEGQLDQGEFLLEKPGNLRFAFNPPNPTLIVATGGKIYVKNSKLNTVESYDVSDVPLDLLLDDKVNLKANSAITGIDIHDDSLVVHARTSTNRQQGNITFVFSNPQIELRQWTVKDNQGGTTMVALQNPEVGVPIDETLFAVPTKAPRKTD
ncbi:MAG TPA: outer membrane lipoprotein carrier protein LolA [Rhizomicrobium sp.]|jgi:outer membrane lipoprotein-sorting protein|nr:outer membrane lipoprotein carrier protein LolA [Rhizomicrobium sp.]